MNILTVTRKELLDLVRDRRALLAMVGLPIVAFPLILMILVVGVTIVLRVNYDPPHPYVPEVRKSGTVWIEGLADLPPALVERLKKKALVLQEPASASPKEALKAGKVQAIVRPVAALDSVVGAVTTTTLVEVQYWNPAPNSWSTQYDVRLAFEAWRDDVTRERLRARELPETFTLPLVVKGLDLSKEEKAAPRTPQRTTVDAPDPTFLRVGRALIAFVTLTIIIMGAYMPGMELGVGEKERGTLETVLLAPLARWEIALGKALAIFATSMGCTAVCLASGALTFSPVAIGGKDALSPLMTALHMSPGTALLVLVALIPEAALLSCVCLGLSTWARSPREAGAYLAPLLTVAVLLGTLGLAPVSAQSPAILLPVGGAVVVVRDLLAGEVGPVEASVYAVSHLGYAVFAVVRIARLYDLEEVLVRPAAAAPGFGITRRSEDGLPSPVQGVALGVLGLVLTWMVAMPLQAHAGPVLGLAASLVLVFLIVPLVFAKLIRVEIARTFSLARPSGRALLGAAFVAFGTALVAPDIFQKQASVTGELLPQEVAYWERIAVEIRDLGPVGALLLVAVLPGLCEEVFFRGFVLRALRAQGAPHALVLSSAFFALAHLDPARFGVTFVVGLVLGGLVLRTGSIFPAMLAHALHNGLSGALGPIESNAPLRVAAGLSLVAGLAIARPRS